MCVCTLVYVTMSQPEVQVCPYQHFLPLRMSNILECQPVYLFLYVLRIYCLPLV